MKLSPILKSFLPLLFLAVGGFFAIPQEAKAAYPMGVLSLRYFPLQSGTNNLNVAITGMSDDWNVINAKISGLESSIISVLNDGSKYHLYKNPAANASLNYYFVAQLSPVFQALPLGLQVPWKVDEGIFDVYRPDYKTILQNLNICDYVDNQGVTEVWLWGYHTDSGIAGAQSPYTEPVESNMSMGRASQSFWNMGSYGDVSNSEKSDDMPVCNKTYYLYNYNYGRGLGEAMEDHGHQMEATFNFVDYFLFWKKFVEPYGSSAGTNSCGWTHMPPNTAVNYDWQNSTPKTSNCEDWHPDGTGQVKQISCSTWGCSDVDGAAFKKWWMQNIPGLQNGLQFQGANLKNWWDFIGDFDSAMAAGKLLTAPRLVDVTPPVSTITAPALGSWQNDDLNDDGVKNDPYFSVSITDQDETEGSGLDSCGYHVYDMSLDLYTKAWVPRTCNSTINISVGPGGDCRTEGGECWIMPYAIDGGGNNNGDTAPLGWFYIDWTSPVNSSITSPAAGSTQSSNFDVVVSNDGDSGGSGNNCYYHVSDSSAGWTKNWEPRTCNSSFNVTVGSSGDCQANGGTCTVYAFSQDNAGNVSVQTSRTFNISLPQPVTLCGGINYGETCKGFNSDVPRLSAAGFNDYAASSAKIMPGYAGTLYTSWDYQGTYVVLNSDTPDIGASNVCFNDNASSLKITPAGSAPVPKCTNINDPCLVDIPSSGSGTIWGDSAVINPGARYWKFTLTGTYTARLVSAFTCDGRLKVGTTPGGSEICNVNSAIAGGAESCQQTLGSGTYYVTNSCDSGCGISTARVEYSFVCSKAAAVINDTVQVTVPTSGGTKQCSVDISHAGQDLSDSSAVKYESTGLADSRTVEMDDAPVGSGGCDLDLSFKTQWQAEAGGKLNVYSVAEKKNAANDLSWQYGLSASDCVIQAVQMNNCSSDPNTSGEAACANPTVSASGRAAVKKHGIKGNYESAAGTGYGGINSDFKFTFVECTQDSHCTDPAKTKCNLSAKVCEPADTVAPTASIKVIRNSTGETVRDGNTDKWLNNDTYTIQFDESDNVGSSGWKTCKYYIGLCDINGLNCSSLAWPVTDRACQMSTSINIEVPFGPGTSFDQDGGYRYGIYSVVEDNAGNMTVSYRNVRTDFQKPTAQ